MSKKIFEKTIEKINDFYFGEADFHSVEQYIEFYTYLRKWMLWYPDLFLDFIKPEGGIELDTDQRIFIRSLARFDTVFYVASRATGKSFVMMLFLIIYAITHPNVIIIYSAQSKEASARIMKDKYSEIKKFFPLFKDEIDITRNDKENVVWSFDNGAIIKNSVTGEGARGSRGHMLVVDEAGFVDNNTMEEIMLPIIDEPRKNVKNSKRNPHEFTSVKYISSAGYRNSSAHNRFIDFYKQTCDNSGTFCFSTDYKAPLAFHRTLTKPKLKQRKKSMGKVTFDMNYGSIWGGSKDGGVLPTEILETSRVLEKPEITSNKVDNSEYFFGIDVARSDREINNEGSIVIGKAHYDNGQVYSLDVVNIVKLSASLTMEKQAIKIKKLEQIYSPKAIVVDANIIGSGLRDELTKSQVDNDGNKYIAFNTINTPKKPDEDTYKTILFSLQSSTTESSQTNITKSLMNNFSSNKVRLLKAHQINSYDERSKENFRQNEVPFYETEMLLEEIFNLELRHNEKTNTLTVKRRTTAINKDRYSALSYLVWYCFDYENERNKKLSNKSDLYKYASLVN